MENERVTGLYSISNLVSEFYASVETRRNIHVPNSSLNVMLIKLVPSSSSWRYHRNVDRDEVFRCIYGEIICRYIDDCGIEREVKLTSSSDDFFFIGANTLHHIFAVTEHACLMEFIGGKYFKGATEYEGNG